MQYNITLMGAIAGESPYHIENIEKLLALPQTGLVHGQTFTGRPHTRLHIDDHNILKIRAELHFDEKSARRWVAQAIEKERVLNVHFPTKTWFVAAPQEDGEALIGSICPLLKPLHSLLNNPTQNSSEAVDWLEKIWRMYFKIATIHNLRLDEGLSNFGLAKDGQIYYLDDDVYNWDCFLSAAQALGVYLRGLPWLTEESCAELGGCLRELILEFFGQQYFTVLAELIRNVFIPETKTHLLNALVNTLMRGQAKTRSAPPKNSQRFIALLADVHSNLPALECVLTYLKNKNITEGVVLGDVVGYGPHPAQCIERLQNSGLVILKGNHDHGLATGEFTKGFSKTAQWALNWNMTQVNAEHRQWLENLPPMLLNDQWLAVHGSPIDPLFFYAYVYEMTYERNLDTLENRKISLCFHGHTHLPGMYGRMNGVSDQHYFQETIDLTRFSHSLICPGSIGQPRNRQLGAQFAIFDRTDNKIHFKCLDYPIDKTIRDMEANNFPHALISILKPT
jgi:predicted phosphodiesterase